MNFVVTDDIMSGTLNATVGMFTPATQYSCAITASTSAGSGTAERRDLITCKERVLPVYLLINPEFLQSNQQLTDLNTICKVLPIRHYKQLHKYLT